MLYVYGMKYRGYAPGCQPRGAAERWDDFTGKYHDLVVYDRALSDAEISDYELEYIGVAEGGVILV